MENDEMLQIKSHGGLCCPEIEEELSIGKKKFYYVINYTLVNLQSELSIIKRLSRPRRMTLSTHTGEDALDAMFQYVKIKNCLFH